MTETGRVHSMDRRGPSRRRFRRWQILAVTAASAGFVSLRAFLVVSSSTCNCIGSLQPSSAASFLHLRGACCGVSGYRHCRAQVPRRALADEAPEQQLEDEEFEARLSSLLAVDPCEDSSAYVEALKDDASPVRRAAIEKLFKTGPRLSPASEELMEGITLAALDDDWKVRFDAACTLGCLGEADQMRADPYIARIAWLLKKKEDPELKVKCAEALGRIGPPAHPYSRVLGAKMDDPDWRVRKACSDGIRYMGTKVFEYKAALMRLKQDDVAIVRESAEDTMWRIPFKKEAPYKHKPGWLRNKAKAARERANQYSRRGRHKMTNKLRKNR